MEYGVDTNQCRAKIFLIILNSATSDFRAATKIIEENKDDDIVAQRFVISQQLVVDKETQKESYLTKILQDQKIIWNKTNDQPTSYKDVKVYGGDDWYESTEGIVELSHLKISDKAPPSGKN